MPPAFTPIPIHEQSCIERDVLTFHTSAGVYQTVGPNHPSARIAQDSELAVHYLLPHGNCVLAVVHADGYETCVESVKLFFVTRELAQLGGTIGSPIATIEDQDHALAA